VFFRKNNFFAKGFNSRREGIDGLSGNDNIPKDYHTENDKSLELWYQKQLIYHINNQLSNDYA